MGIGGLVAIPGPSAGFYRLVLLPLPSSCSDEFWVQVVEHHTRHFSTLE